MLMKKPNRRNFLKSSSLGTLGLVSGIAAEKSLNVSKIPNQAKNPNVI